MQFSLAPKEFMTPKYKVVNKYLGTFKDVRSIKGVRDVTLMVSVNCRFGISLVLSP